MNRRDFITLLGSATVAWPRAVRAQRAYERFIPFLIDLPGWTGSQPTGTEKERNGGRVITASRSYMRGEARFVAGLTSGTAALGAGDDPLYIFHNGVHKTTSTIDGFQVVTQSTAVFVQIAIALSPDAVFSLLFNKVPENEAMAIAQKFDWKGIAALLD